jgi:hypothetical protein
MTLPAERLQHGVFLLEFLGHALSV